MPNKQSMHAGSSVPLPEDPAHVPYIPPEAIIQPPDSAASSGVSVSAVATAEADIWALGVLAFELLTHTRAFSSVEGGQGETFLKKVYAALAGDEPLPWESGSTKKDDDAFEVEFELWRGADKLPGAKGFVLQCLNRNPADRPPAGRLVSAWEDLVANNVLGK
jgi:serine/threonine protein kinase